MSSRRTGQVPGLPLWDCVGPAGRAVFRVRKISGQKLRLLPPPGPPPIAPQTLRRLRRRQALLHSQVFKQPLRQPRQRDAVAPPRPRVKPVAPLHERREGRSAGLSTTTASSPQNSRCCPSDPSNARSAPAVASSESPAVCSAKSRTADGRCKPSPRPGRAARWACRAAASKSPPVSPVAPTPPTGQTPPQSSPTSPPAVPRSNRRGRGPPSAAGG